MAAIVLTQPAFALEPGVHVSPSSPAGIEYAFPLGSTRGDLSGAPPSVAPASTYAAPLFGVGLAPAPAQTNRGHKTRPKPPPSRAITDARRIEATVGAGSLGGLVLPLVGGVLLAGILGGLLGSALRRRTVDS